MVHESQAALEPALPHGDGKGIRCSAMCGFIVTCSKSSLGSVLNGSSGSTCCSHVLPLLPLRLHKLPCYDSIAFDCAFDRREKDAMIALFADHMENVGSRTAGPAQYAGKELHDRTLA